MENCKNITGKLACLVSDWIWLSFHPFDWQEFEKTWITISITRLLLWTKTLTFLLCSQFRHLRRKNGQFDLLPFNKINFIRFTNWTLCVPTVNPVRVRTKCTVPCVQDGDNNSKTNKKSVTGIRPSYSQQQQQLSDDELVCRRVRRHRRFESVASTFETSSC